MGGDERRRIFVEGLPGQRFEAEVPCGTTLETLAVDFFVNQGWPLQDNRGRGQRAVVELVNPHNPDETKRLNSTLDVCQAGLKDGDTLRVFPEAIAAVDQTDRLTALVSDHNAMLEFQAREPRISFTANRTHAPDRYEVTLRFISFIDWIPGQLPRCGDEHRVEIVLTADYPRESPRVRWLTPIFHPNIRPDREFVCIGELSERWRPGLGLARLVLMLAEMVQYHNFNPLDGCNRDASLWAGNPANAATIEAIGGHPFQGPVGERSRARGEGERGALVFKPV